MSYAIFLLNNNTSGINSNMQIFGCSLLENKTLRITRISGEAFPVFLVFGYISDVFYGTVCCRNLVGDKPANVVTSFSGNDYPTVEIIERNKFDFKLSNVYGQIYIISPNCRFSAEVIAT